MAAAVWFPRARAVELRAEAVRDPRPHEVRVRAVLSGLSHGTERLVYRGEVDPSLPLDLPSLAGGYGFPVKYGYASAGRVVAAGREVESAREGDLVFALHPHQTKFDLPADAVVPLPAGIPLPRAVLAANVETALNATWDAAPGPSGRIAVVGAGVVGALVAFLCAQIEGAEVTLIDIDPSRAALARTLGIGFSTPEAAPGDCDLVVHASGSAAGLATAIGLAGNEATVLELSWYGTGEVAVPLGGAFHSRRLRLVASQVGQVAASHRPRWTHRRRLAAALDLLADPRLDALLAPAVAFHDLPARLSGILAPESGVLCQLIDYPAA